MFNITSFLTYLVITATTPGPNNIMSMSNASKYGFRKSFLFNLGIFVGFSVIMILCTLFSVSLYNILPSIKPIMLLLGFSYMMFLAWKTVKSTGVEAVQKKSSHKTNTFFSGLLLQFANPKIIIYGITATSSFIIPYFDSLPILIGIAFFLAFIGFLGTLCWALFGSVFSQLFSKNAKAFNIIMALLLVYCAVSLFF